jgi:hypothetical protein
MFWHRDAGRGALSPPFIQPDQGLHLTPSPSTLVNNERRCEALDRAGWVALPIVAYL